MGLEIKGSSSTKPDGFPFVLLELEKKEKRRK